jgi:hypothetical protein
MYCKSIRRSPQMRVSTVGWRSVSFDESPAHRLSAVGSLKIALGGSDDGALHQDVPRPGEVVDIDQAGRFGALTQDRANVVEVPDAGLASRMSDTQLEQNADERAAVEVLMFLEPVVKHIEDRQQLFLGRVTAQP